jgi:hypothetical protein
LTPARPSESQSDTSSKGAFSFSLYLKHREYNAGIGAGLLYFSLLFLRQALGMFVHGLR